MNELINSATVTGTFDGDIYSKTSNQVITELINLIFIKSANKTIWARGNLLFILDIINSDSTPYNNLVIIDILNPKYIMLVTDSVRINGIPVAYGSITYNEITGELNINIDSIPPESMLTITFEVRKRNLEIFNLENTAYINFNNDQMINIMSEVNEDNNDKLYSNTIIIRALSSVCKCKEIENRNQC
ncbi:MAG: hypothetical protein GX265_04290 [Mollicutes bacterium]|nr:hypothetical protein [Mollicutes bacterium]